MSSFVMTSRDHGDSRSIFLPFLTPFFGGAKSYKNPMVLQEMLLNKY